MDDILKYAVENGIIDLSYVQEKIEMNKRKELLEKHPYGIYQEKSGYYCTYLPDEKKKRRLVRKKTKEEIETVVIEYWKAEIECPTLHDIFYNWLKKKLEYGEICEGTYDRYENDFKRFYHDERNFGDVKIKNVDEDDVEDFLKTSIAKHELSSKGFSNLRLITLGIFKHAKKKKYIHWSITQLIQDIDISKKSFRKVIKEDIQEVFNDEETEKILSYMENNPDFYNLALILIFATGLRIGELVALKWEDYDGISVKIRRTEIKYKDENKKMIYKIREYPKTEAGVRSVIIPNNYIWVMKRLKAMNPFSEFVFAQDNSWLKTYKVSDRLEHLCKKLNIYKKSPHKIRKTYGSILLDNNVDRNLILQQMGHTDITTTENRYHRNRKNLEVKAQIINSIPELSQTKKAINC